MEKIAYQEKLGSSQTPLIDQKSRIISLCYDIESHYIMERLHDNSNNKEYVTLYDIINHI